MDSDKILGRILDQVGILAGQVAGLAVEVRGISARLDKLNGSVARHEADLITIKARFQADQAKPTLSNVLAAQGGLMKLVLTVALAAILALSGTGAKQILEALASG